MPHNLAYVGHKTAMFRLGEYRRNLREYSVHQRRTGMDAGDVLEAKRLLDLGVRMGIVAVLLSKELAHTGPARAGAGEG
jgi:hypothetical protein